uniref:CCHC-type domain-containing protein n=1 Tax=Strongyloides papillosus TaxID=174720 RepID=A0A0N5BPY6_STREA
MFNQIVSLASYRGGVPYDVFFANELFLREIDTSDTKAITTFIYCQTEETRQEFYQIYPDLREVTWDNIQEFVCDQAKPTQLSMSEVLSMFHKETRKTDEPADAYAIRLKAMLREHLSAPTIDNVVMMKMHSQLPRDVLPDLVETTQVKLSDVVKVWDIFLRKLRVKASQSTGQNSYNHPSRSSHNDGSFRRSNPNGYGNMKFSQPVHQDTYQRSGWNSNLPNQQSIPNKRTNQSPARDSQLQREPGNQDHVYRAPKPCYTCGIIGHYSTNCPSKVVQQKSINLPDSFTKAPLIYECVSIADEPQIVLVDCGAQGNILGADKIHNFLSYGVTYCEDMMAQGIGEITQSIKASVTLPVYYIGTQKLYSALFYFIEGSETIINHETAYHLVIDILSSLDEMVSSKLLTCPHIYDETVIYPKLEAEITFISPPESKLSRPYNLNAKGKEILSKHLAKELRLGRIRYISNPIISSPCCIAMSDKPRVCNDSRYVNKFLTNVDVILPTIEEIQCAISDTQFFTKFDLSDAFKQIRVSENQQYISTISTFLGTFVSDRLQFGYRPASGIFHNLLSSVMSHIPNKIHFIDDIIIIGDFETQRNGVLSFIDVCAKYNLKLNLSKCMFFQDQVPFLGHVLTKGAIIPDITRTESLSKISKPITGDDMKAVLGRFSYVGKFIKQFANVTAPLHPTVEKIYHWSQVREKHWEMLLEAARNYMKLHYPPKDVELILQFIPTEFSFHVEIYFLEEKEKKLVNVVMRKMKNHEIPYSLIEKELAAISEAIVSANHLIQSRQVKIVSHSKMVETLTKQPLDLMKNNSTRLQRLLSPIILSNLPIQYISRPLQQVDVPKLIIKNLNIKNDRSVNTHQTVTLLRSYLKGELQKIIKLPHSIQELLPKLHLVQDLICFDFKPLVSKQIAEHGASWIHQLNHSGETLLYEELNSKIVFKGLSTIAKETVKNCLMCQKTRINVRKQPRSWSPALYPRHRGHFDIGYFEGHTIVLLVDAYSNYLHAAVIPNKKPDTIIAFFEPIICNQYPYRILVSDNEPVFRSKELIQFFETCSIYYEYPVEVMNSIPYTPTTNGLAEKYVGLLKRKLVKGISQNMSFKQSFKWSVDSLNNTINSRTKHTPARLYYVNNQEPVHDLFPSKLITVEEKHVFFKRRGESSKVFEEGTIIAQLGSRTYLIKDSEQNEIFVSKDFVHFGKECPTIKFKPLEGLENTFLMDEENPIFQASSPSPPAECVENETDERLQDEASEPLWKILECEAEGISLKNEDEFYDFVDKLPQDASYLMIDGSTYQGAGIGLYGVLGENDIVLSVRNYLRGKSTSPRLEVEALHSALRLITYFKIKECVIFSDNSYCVNAINKHWLWKWVETKTTSKKKNVPAYLSTWTKIAEMWSPKFLMVHVRGHKIAPHNIADRLARGESVELEISELPFQRVKRIYFPIEGTQEYDLRRIAISQSQGV